jgi:hypothetical protein
MIPKNSVAAPNTTAANQTSGCAPGASASAEPPASAGWPAGPAPTAAASAGSGVCIHIAAITRR